MTDTREITVSVAAPIASFIVAPAAPVVNQPVQFISTASDSDGVITDQAWDLNGDGLFDNGGGPSALRSFAAGGPVRRRPARHRQRRAHVLPVADDHGRRAARSDTASDRGPAAAQPVPGRADIRRADQARRAAAQGRGGRASRVDGARRLQGAQLSLPDPDQRRVEELDQPQAVAIGAAPARGRPDPDLHHQPRHDRQVHVVQDPAREVAASAWTGASGTARRGRSAARANGSRPTRRRRYRSPLRTPRGGRGRWRPLPFPSG